MKLITTALLPSVIGIICSANAQSAEQNGTVDWAPCPDQNGTTPTQCGTLTVPLDYSEPTSDRTLDLQLVKVSAVNQPRQGSILFNPGGPGESGLSSVRDNGNAYLIATGGYHDLIGFDPRGVGNTISFLCFNTTTERLRASGPFQKLINASDTALGSIWAGSVTMANLCYENNREYGEMLGTAFVARDMIRIAEALDDDGLLRYWGFSYGTLLGATTAAMFPERIDRMVLDGVTNVHQWYNGIAIEAGVQADTALNGFFEACITNPDQCPLAQDGNSALDLLQQIYQLLDTLKIRPYILGNDPTTGLVDYASIKQAIFTSLYDPNTWETLGGILHGLLTGNMTASTNDSPLAEFLAGGFGDDPAFGIQCGDTSLRSDNLTALLPLIDATVASSRIAGEILVNIDPIACAVWRFVAKERYSGDFQAQTKNPILFVSGPFDPVTPLVSAYNVSTGFEGSVVLQHNGYGHTSTGQASLCTARNIRTYFVNGTLPAPGTVCQPDQVLFSNETFVETIEPLRNMTKRALEHDDDASLLAAVKRLSRNSRIGRRF